MAEFWIWSWNESAKIKFFNLLRHDENFHFNCNCWKNGANGAEKPIEIIFEPWNESPKMKFREIFKILKF